MKIIKILKKVLVGLLILVSLIIGTTAVLFWFYGDSVKKKILNSVNSHLTARVNVGEIRLSFIHGFPDLSIEFTHVNIENPVEGAPDESFLTAGKLRLHFDTRQVLQGNYILKSATITDASLNIFITENGLANYFLWEKSENEESHIVLEMNSVRLKSVRTTYMNQRTKEKYTGIVKNAVAEGNFGEQLYNLSLKGNFHLEKIQIQNNVYLKDEEADIDLIMAIDNSTKSYEFKKGSLSVKKLDFIVTGKINHVAEDQSFIDLVISGGRSNLKDYLRALPETYHERIEKYTGMGLLEVFITIKGIVGSDSSPLFKADFNLQNGIITRKETGTSLKNINLSATYRIPSATYNPADKLEIHSLSGIIMDNKIEGSGTIINLNNPQLSFDISARADLESLMNLVQPDAFRSVEGSMNARIEFEGHFQDVHNIRLSDIAENSITGNISLSETSFQLKNDPLLYHKINGDLRFSNNDLMISALSGKVSSSFFEIKGTIGNIIPFFILKDETLDVEANIHSEKLHLDELLYNAGNETDTLYRLELPENILLDIKFIIDHLQFQKFNAYRAEGSALYQNKILTLGYTEFETMKGKVGLQGFLNGNATNRFVISTKVSLNHIDISNLFYQFDNFGMSGLTYHHLKGSASGRVDFSADLYPDLQPDLGSIDADVFLMIDHGEIVRYKPLMTLSKYIKINDLEHIAFSRLENQIRIHDYAVHIPDMEIVSGSFIMNLKGIHRFNNDIEYHLDLLLSDLLTRKVSRNKQEEFGVLYEDDERAHLYILLAGSAENPEIRYDTKAVRKKISTEIKKETNEIKSILKDEFKWISQDSTVKAEEEEIEKRIKKQEEGHFIIEWDRDSSEHNHGAGEKTPEKIRGSRFKVEWDDDTAKSIYPLHKER